MKIKVYNVAYAHPRKVAGVRVVVPPMDSNLDRKGVKYICTSFNRENKPMKVTVGMKDKSHKINEKIYRASDWFDKGKDRVFGYGKNTKWIEEAPSVKTFVRRFVNSVKNIF